MKANWKEILIIIVLALITTLLSTTVKQELGCGGGFPCITGDAFVDKGWPVPFIVGMVAGEFCPVCFLINLIFYFVLFQLVWKVSRRIIKK